MKAVLSILVALILGLSLLACGLSKDAEANAFVERLDAMTNDIAAKINADGSKTGVEAAVSEFDAGKDDLTKKWNAVKDARENQVSADVKNKLKDSIDKDVDTLLAVAAKIKDPQAFNQYRDMILEFNNLFQEKK